MNWKKDLQKLEKSLRGRKKKVAKKISGYFRKQKLTQGDLVLAVSLGLIFLTTMVLAGVFVREFNKSYALDEKVPSYGVLEDRKPNPTLRSIVLGIQRTAAARGAAETKNTNPAALNLPILMYHRVDNHLIVGDRFAAGLTVPTANFESQLAYLKEHGYQTISFDDLYKAFYNNTPLPPKSVLLTFDDGYEDNYLFAYPLLKKYDLKATFFVATAFTDTNKYYMTSAQLKEMAEGGMNIEAHSMTHPDLTKISKQRLIAELTDSRQRLQAITGKDIFFFAYPFGSYNPIVELETKNAGYLMAVTTKPGRLQKGNAPYALLRYRVGPGTTIAGFSSLISH